MLPLFGYTATSPGEAIRERLKSRGWTQDEFAIILGRARRTVSDLISGKSSLTPEMAVAVAAAFDEDPQDWLRMEVAHRLGAVSQDTDRIKHLAKLFAKAPIRDMQRRGWIKETEEATKLQSELDEFFDGGDVLPVSARRTMALPQLNPAETAWCHRARNLAATLMVPPFSVERLTRAKPELRKMAAHPKESRHLSALLSSCGIRFLIIEPLPTVRIDGAAFWDDFGPVVALSLRYDRMDSFWFTVMHELSHIRHGDPTSIDTGLVDPQGMITLSGDVTEERANKEAATMLIPANEIDSFISRVGPLYSRDRIVQFANRIKIHPGIIVGQLQHRGQIGFTALREFLVKVREMVISTTLTDGWGQVISPAVKRGRG